MSTIAAQAQAKLEALANSTIKDFTFVVEWSEFRGYYVASFLSPDDRHEAWGETSAKALSEAVEVAAGLISFARQHVDEG